MKYSGKMLFLAGTIWAISAGDSCLKASVVEAWAVGDGEKVFRYETDHRSRAANSIWDGKTIRLEGLYNEVLAFQVIVVADSTGAEAVEITVDPPLNAKSGKAIGASRPLNYGPQGTIELFSQHYLQVTKPTPPSWVYGSPAAAPEKMTGWIPDALIPPEAKPGSGGFPLDIPPTKRTERRVQNILEVVPAAPLQNQGFWIDLHLPRDRSFPPGIYLGSVKVWEKGGLAAQIPLELTLLPHYLPDENHANVWMYSDGVDFYFPELTADQVEKMLKHEAHRHRIDLVGGFPAHQGAFDRRIMEKYKGYLDGTAFTPAQGYQGPGQGEGEHIFPIGMYGAITNSVMKDKESAQLEADRWVEWFDGNAPGVVYFWYIIDEPGRVQFPWIRERADWIHQSSRPGKRLKVFTTRSYTEELDGAVDIWAGGHRVDVQIIEQLKKQGIRHWFYNGQRPNWGSTVLEMDAVDTRMIGWVKYIYGIETWFYWHGTQWYHNWQGPKGHLHQRVFSVPLTFTSDGTDLCNGEGVMFYPGRMPFYPDEDRGLSRLLPSIRLKNIRRGQQDYEIMYLAEQKAGREKVLEIVRQVVPKALSEVDNKGPVPWSQRGDDYDRARARLLALLK